MFEQTSSIPSPEISLAIALPGNLEQDPATQVKYGFFVNALAEQTKLTAVIDAQTSGLSRLSNALRSFSPNRSRWKERFYKNPSEFVARSKNVARQIASLPASISCSLQVGVLFDAGWSPNVYPNLIYTDYTACLSARKPDAGRSAFTPREKTKWLALEKQAYHRAAHVFTRSKLVQTSLIDDYGVAPKKISVVGGGVNFDPLPEIKSRNPVAQPTILFIGKEFHRKGGDILLEAFSLVRQRVSDAQLNMVVKAPTAEGFALDGVEIIEPTWDRDKIADLFQRADLFVLPSRLETWGDVLLEAMAFGLPCIGVDSDAIAEIIVAGQTGLVVPPENANALADAIARVLQDPALRQSMGQAARRRVETELSWSAVVSRIIPYLPALS